MTDWNLIERLAEGVDLETLTIDDCGDGKGGVDAREFVVALVNAWPEIKQMRASARPEEVRLPRALAEKILELHKMASDALVDSNGDVHREVVAELQQCMNNEQQP